MRNVECTAESLCVLTKLVKHLDNPSYVLDYALKHVGHFEEAAQLIEAMLSSHCAKLSEQQVLVLVKSFG